MSAFDPAPIRAYAQDSAGDWTARETQLYAIGVGAEELPFVYEQGLVALPTMPVVLAYTGFGSWAEMGMGIDPTKILHGETEVILHRPLPVAGHFSARTQVEAIYDKGADKGCVIRLTRTIKDAEGNALATVNNSTFLREHGGFGSDDRQPPPRAMPTDRVADDALALPIAENQALIYRLSGDYNPLHCDPAVAKAAGFERPILHGLCSFGIAGRAILRMACGNDPTRLRAIGVRFSSPVYPGETLLTEIWRTGDTRIAFRVTVPARGVVVLNNGYAELA